MFPAATSARNVVHRGIFALLGLATLSRPVPSMRQTRQLPRLSSHIFLFFITENSQKFWVFRNFGSATGPRLVWFPTLATGLLSNGLWRHLTVCRTGRDGLQVVDSRRLKGAVRLGPFGPQSITDASTLPPGPSRSDGVPRVYQVLIKDWDVFHILSSLSMDETWTPDSFGVRLNISCLVINLKDNFGGYLTFNRSRNLLKLFFNC